MSSVQGTTHSNSLLIQSLLVEARHACFGVGATRRVLCIFVDGHGLGPPTRRCESWKCVVRRATSR
eukprot:scaffold12857_cov135-Isochrysis_galbana.AAC.3